MMHVKTIPKEVLPAHHLPSFFWASSADFGMTFLYTLLNSRQAPSIVRRSVSTQMPNNFSFSLTHLFQFGVQNT